MILLVVGQAADVTVARVLLLLLMMMMMMMLLLLIIASFTVQLTVYSRNLFEQIIIISSGCAALEFVNTLAELV